MKHEENGLVFEDSEELAAQLQVAMSATCQGGEGSGDWHWATLPDSCFPQPGWDHVGYGGKAREGAEVRGQPTLLSHFGTVGWGKLGHTPQPALWIYGADTPQMMLEPVGRAAVQEVIRIR